MIRARFVKEDIEAGGSAHDSRDECIDGVTDASDDLSRPRCRDARGADSRDGCTRERE
jgi:hypothetical protein